MTLTLDTTITLNNGVAMPQLGLGVYLADRGSETENAVQFALEAGYRHIDTASIYGNEREVGHVVNAGVVPRDEVFVTSKLWVDSYGYDGAMQGFDETMDKIGLDYLDLYLIHWPTGDWQGAWRALEELYQSGRIKAIGVSNFMPHHLDELLQLCTVRPAVNQVEMHPYLQQPELHKACQDAGIAVTAWSPIMQGRVMDVPELVAIGEKYGKSAVQVTLRWMLQLGVIVIPKSAKQYRIESNADLYDFALSDEDMATIRALDKGERIGPDPDTFRG